MDVTAHEDVKKLVDKAPVSNVSNNERVKRWRRNNRAAYNAYMRGYMVEWRKRKRAEKQNEQNILREHRTGRSPSGGQ